MCVRSRCFPPVLVLCLTLAALLLGTLIPALAAADLPPLIPREALLGNPEKTSPQISPDGTRLGFLAPSGKGVLNIWVETLGRDDAEMVTADTLRGIFGFNWAEDGEHLLYVQDRNGDENWHLYATNMNTREVRNLTPFPGAAADQIMTDRNHPTTVLVGLNNRDPRYFDLHRIDLATGTTTLEAENPGDVQEWATDNDFHVRACMALDPETSDTIIRVRDTAGGPWRELVRWPFLEAGSVLYKKILGFTRDGKGLYVQTCMGSDMARLVVIDLEKGREIREVASDPKSDIWNVWWVPQVVMNPSTHEPEAVGLYYLKPRWEVLDKKVEGDFKKLSAQESGVFEITGRDRADKKWIVRYFADTMPGRYYLYERDSGKLTLLLDSAPQLANYTLAPVKPVVYTARDGLQIPAYLTLPVGVEPKNLPFILFPHGGPWADDQWVFDPVVQLLANRGYAVLQPNFRGSTGYGRNHLNAGNGEWGRAMQNDLSDGVKWAVDQGITDPKRVAIAGGSYGGYATLAGITFTPELYTCAVAMVAPSNVKILFESFPPSWAIRKKRWMLRVGDVEGDDELNRRISPLFHVDRIRAPLFIAHGANDPRVKQAESDAIVKAMREQNRPVTYIVFPDEGHGFARPQNNLDIYGRVEEFLAKHLGGRAEPWKEIPGSSAEVR